MVPHCLPTFSPLPYSARRTIYINQRVLLVAVRQQIHTSNRYVTKYRNYGFPTTDIRFREKTDKIQNLAVFTLLKGKPEILGRNQGKIFSLWNV